MKSPEERREACRPIVEKFEYEKWDKVWPAQCPLCKNHRAAVTRIADGDRYGFPATYSLCADCGTVYADPRLSDEGYAVLYRGVYRELVSAYWGVDASPQRVSADGFAYGRTVWEWIKERVLRGKRNNIRILDVGGGTGAVLRTVVDRVEAANRVVIEATVVDPSGAEAEFAEALGLSVIHRELEYAELELGYDLILMCRTIDHLSNPGVALECAHELLKEDGFLYVDIVDWPYVVETEGCRESFHIDHPVNLNRHGFTCALAQRYGFPIRQVGLFADGLEIGFLCGHDKLGGDVTSETGLGIYQCYRTAQAREAREAGHHPLRPKQ